MNLDAKNTLDQWINFVSSHKLNSIVNLYSKDAVLLGTFAKKISLSTDEIESYFIQFLKKKPNASFSDIYCVSSNGEYSVFNGNYIFNIEDGSSVNARFTFVLKKYENWKIITHHSSIKPLSIS